MTPEVWTYPGELADALSAMGLHPAPTTRPRFVRDAVNDLYRYELRRLRSRLLAGEVAKADYISLVIALRKKYWPLTLSADAWERICEAGRS